MSVSPEPLDVGPSSTAVRPSESPPASTPSQRADEPVAGGVRARGARFGAWFADVLRSMRTGTPRRASFARGVGLLGGLATAAAVGLGDGIATLVRAPAGTLSWRSAVLVLLHSVAVLATFGLFIGSSQEVLLASARRRPRLVAFGHALIDGPRRWFAPNHRAALAVVMGGLYFALVAGPVLPFSYSVIEKFHSHVLAACAIFLCVATMAVVGAAVVTMIAWPVGWMLERAGPFASPGMIVSLVLAAAIWQTRRFILLNTHAFGAIDAIPVVIGGAALGVDAIVLGVVARAMRKRGRPPRVTTVAAFSVAAVVAFGISALTFGSRQTVASAVFSYSKITGSLVRVLQRVIDVDHDRYGALFGGGDCNDRNAAIHPGARDIPDNGIDENCTGADARHEDDLGDGRMVQVVGPLANVQPSFVLISIDAVRPDHVGAYGYRRNTTPNIDRFAREAAVFTNAYCTSPRSLRSFTSIWVGRYPALIHWGLDNQYLDLLPENATLAEQLTRSGYTSVGLSNADYFHRTAGFFQGFTEWHEPTNEWKGDVWEEVTRANTFLETHANDAHPFFMWAHMMEPHDGYRHWPEHNFGTASVDDYDSEIARADDATGRVLAVVDRIAAQRPVVVAIFSDHGEAFGEHGYYNHSSDLHEEQARVMLIVRGPGIAPGQRRSLTSLMDLNPTILNYVGRPVEQPVDARSLVPVLQNPNAPYVGGSWRDHLFLEVSPDGLIPFEQKGLIAPPYKLIYDVARGLFQLYDLSHDPRENANLVDDDPVLANRMRERLLSWVDASSLPSNRSDDIIAANRLSAPPVRFDVPLHVRFGEVVELIGADIPTPRVRHDEVLRVVLYYRVLRATADPYWIHTIFNATDGGGSGWRFQASHHPIHGRYSTSRWIPGEILRDEIPLRVEPEIRATRYAIDVKFQADNWGPVLMPDGHTAPGDPNSVRVGTFEVVP